MKRKATMATIILIITVCLFFTVTVMVRAQVTESEPETEETEALTLEQICERTELRKQQEKFEEVMAYLDEYYPNRTVGEELELLKKFCNPVELNFDNGPSSIAIYSDSETKTDDEEQKEMADVKEAWYKDYTERDIYLLAVLMYAEMEEYMDDCDAEKVAKAVASVVLHRVRSQGYYPNDIEKVIWQNYGKRGQQYATRTLNMISENVTPPEKCYQWAEELLIEGPVGPDNLVFEDNKPHGNIWWQYGKLYFCTAEL